MANFLDKTIGWFSPEAEIRRVKARIQLHAAKPLLEKIEKRALDGASKGRRTAGWKAVNDSPSSVTQGGLALLRARSRDLVQNNPYAGRAVDVLSSNIVGVGIIPQARSKVESIKTAFDDLWVDWAEDTHIDADGQTDIYGLQALIIETIAKSGECLVRRRWRPDSWKLPIPLQLQVLEPDYLDSTKDGVLDNGNMIIQGVEFDRRGRRVAYHLFTQHPGDAMATLNGQKTVRIDASEILHLFRVERPGQVRGIPWGARAIIKLRDLDEAQDAHLVRQKIAACFTAFVHDMSADEPGEDMSSKKVIPDRVEPGMIEYCPPGKEVTFGAPPSVEGFVDFNVINLQAIAVAYNVSYEALTGDYSRVNFSSGRMGWIEFHRYIEKIRYHMMIPRFCNPVWRWMVEAAEVAGIAKGPCRATHTPPRREMIDPSKEVAATKEAIKGGLLTRSEALRQNGYDPDSVYQELAEDQKKADSLGIRFDTDARTPKASE